MLSPPLSSKVLASKNTSLLFNLIIGDKIAPLPFPPETDKVNGLSILNS
jgi:hypothetical protein